MKQTFEMSADGAWELVGGLSKPSKMPCHGYSIPAKRCKVGSKLREVAGSICSKCYAMKGRYTFANVANALERRFASLEDPAWIDAMVVLISKHCAKSGHFRWHDAGDVQSVQHLSRIMEVCRRTPDIRHWLPTREYQAVREWKAANGEFPENLCVRASLFMLNQAFNRALTQGLGCPSSGASQRQTRPSLANVRTVAERSIDAVTTYCPAPQQGGKCGDCRNCWNRDVTHVGYKVH